MKPRLDRPVVETMVALAVTSGLAAAIALGFWLVTGLSP